VNDSFEFSVFVDGKKIDVFILYPDDANNISFIAGLEDSTRMRLKYIYPKLQNICSVLLYDHVFYVPCNVETFMTAEYGPDWQIPVDESNYVWYESARNIKHMGYWNLQDWPIVYRKYREIRKVSMIVVKDALFVIIPMLSLFCLVYLLLFRRVKLLCRCW